MANIKRFLLMGAALLGTAHVSAQTNEVSNLTLYGNCFVFDLTDALTDAKRHRLWCDYDANDSDWVEEVSSVRIDCYRTEGWVTYLELEDEIIFHLEETIPVLYRFDKRSLGEGDWHWQSDGSYAYSFSSDVASEFSEGIRTANRLVFQIGERKRGVVEFEIDDTNVVRDFLERCEESFYSDQ